MILDLDGLAKLPTRTTPYAHVVMPDFIKREHQAQVLADFPAIADAGLYTPDELNISGQFANTMTELMGKDFENPFGQRQRLRGTNHAPFAQHRPAT